ncbi:MAG: protein adenylyltransferase SelO family protein, partial [Leptothrix sp. (in: b-proteobacteria)]
VLTRVAASHLRVGTFQYFQARGEIDTLRRLADYTVARHDPALVGTPGRYLGLLQAVAQRQAALIARWMNVGFIHGVMNTDNMALSGETIDYGPCAFIEAFDPATVFSSIDHNGRYAYANQPHIARWNLARLAEALLPLMVDADDEAGIQRAVAQLTEVIDAFPGGYETALLQGQRAKLGLLATTPADDAADRALVHDWLALLQAQAVDYTLAWRHLAAAADGHEPPLRQLFADQAALDAWLLRWRERCAQDDRRAANDDHDATAATAATGPSPRAAAMRHASPRIIPRNHLVEAALSAASDHGDLAPFEQLLAAVRNPYSDAAELAPWALPAPASVTAGYQTFCGT